MKKLPLLLSLVVTAFFFACGDDSASNANGTNGEGANSNTSSQGTEIPCDAGSEGIILKPIDSDSYRLCNDGKWVVVEPDKPAEEASSSSTKSPELAEESSSSIKVAEPDDESSSSVKDPEPDDESSSSAKDPEPDDGPSSSVKDPEPVDESSSSAKDLEAAEESSSSNEESKVFLCDDGETYVIDPANCAKNSSSSVVTSSSATSSSSVPSSSSAKSSSSTQSSSSVNKLNWQYLNSKISYGEFTDERDGQVYKTITVEAKSLYLEGYGYVTTQTWMAENLNYAYTQKTSTLDSSSFCYNNDPKFCDRFGRLYLGSAAMDSAAIFSRDCLECGHETRSPQLQSPLQSPIRGVCPEGWHIPNNNEWLNLKNIAGGGRNLRSSQGWQFDTEHGIGGGGTDSLGLAVLPAGYHGATTNGVGFHNIGITASFWSSYSWNAIDFYTGMNNADLNRYNALWAFSVRCVQNPPPKPASSSSVQSSSSSITYGELKDERDKQVYKTVKIGSQTWMAENLNYNYNEGSAKSYCYNNSSSNCNKYGRLYTWSAAMDSASVFSFTGQGCGYGTSCSVASSTSTTKVRGVCPDGWHLPNNQEWETLWKTVGGTSVAGDNLKSTSGWYDELFGDGNGNDKYGFSVYPAGNAAKGNFYNIGNFAYFWSTSADAYSFSTLSSSVVTKDISKDYGLSIRCLKD